METVAALLRSLNLSVEELGRRSRLLPSRVAEIVDGADPSPAELRALSTGLRLPLKSFAVGSTPARSSELAPRFRRLARTAQDDLEPAQEFVAAFIEAALGTLPKRQEPPEWLGQFDGVEESFVGAEILANSFRDWLAPNNHSGPLNDLPQLCDAVPGLIISQIKQSKYEGVSLAAGGYVFVFISPRFSGRMLFTLAHEMGHVLAHHNDETVRFETPSSITRPGSLSERFVDAFASILLLPSDGVGEVLGQIRDRLGLHGDQVSDVEILLLARTFGVGFEVAARRCETLSLIPSGGAASLLESVRSRHGGAERLSAQLGLPPRPALSFPRVSSELLEHSFRDINAEKESGSWLAGRFGLSIEELGRLHSEYIRS